MKKTMLLLLATVLVVGGVAYAAGPDIDNRTPVNPYGVRPDGTKAQFRVTADGEALVSGSVTMQGTTPDGGTAAPRLDQDHRQVVAVGAMPGPSIGADLTTTAAAGPTIPAGAEYLVCALTDLWLRFDGQAATADVPSIPFFARQCRLVGPFGQDTATSGILPAGASVLAGKEVVAIPMTRPQ
jgi:hypothetical protein